MKENEFRLALVEGLEPQPGYMAALTENKDAPNPLYDGVGCTIQYLRFQDLCKQDTPNQLNGHPNPCNASARVSEQYPQISYTRPAVDWSHGNQSRTGGFSGNTAVACD